jgi:hypothetical protein
VTAEDVDRGVPGPAAATPWFGAVSFVTALVTLTVHLFVLLAAPAYWPFFVPVLAVEAAAAAAAALAGGRARQVAMGLVAAWVGSVVCWIPAMGILFLW